MCFLPKEVYDIWRIDLYRTKATDKVSQRFIFLPSMIVNPHPDLIVHNTREEQFIKWLDFVAMIRAIVMLAHKRPAPSLIDSRVSRRLKLVRM